MTFYSFDIVRNPMTFILKLDLDMVKISLCTESEVPSEAVQSYSLTRQTDPIEIIITPPHTRRVTNKIQ